MTVIKILLAYVCLATPMLAKAQSSFFLGGGLGVAVPSNMGEKEFDIGFADVALTGPRMAFRGVWFYNKRLSLAGEAAIARLGHDPAFWQVRKYGDVDATYTVAQVTADGCYYFTERGLIPFVGMGFGGYYLNNSLRFQSAYTGSNADASVNYRTQTIKPGFTPLAGVMAKVSKKTLFYADVKFQIIPNIKPELVYIKDEYGYAVDVVTQNPHGHQNHWTVTVGLLFALRK